MQMPQRTDMLYGGYQSKIQAVPLLVRLHHTCEGLARVVKKICFGELSLRDRYNTVCKHGTTVA